MPESQLDEKYPLRTQRKAATRKKILGAALALAGRDGAVNITMAKVAQQADVHVTTLFTHFASKAELLSGISEPAIEALRIRIEANKGQTPFFAFVKAAQEEFATMMSQKGRQMVDHALYLRTQVELLPAWIDYEKSQVAMMADYILHDYATTPLEARLYAGMIVSANIHSFDEWLSDPASMNLSELTRRNVEAVEQIFNKATLKHSAAIEG